MEMSEQTLAKLKQKMEEALELERRSLLAFTSMNRASVEDIYQTLLADAEETAGYYPDFDLKTELDNPEFCFFMSCGMPVTRAYECVHHGELVTKALLNGFSCGKNLDRPTENGLSTQAAAATPGSMANSTRAQREEIRNRVSRGEKVRL